jgi:hypothetical protein
MIKFLKGFWQGVREFVLNFWKFVFDHFSDKNGFWDEKRTTAFALLVIAICYGVFKLWGTPDSAIFGILMGAGVGQYFNSAYNDGRGPAITQNVIYQGKEDGRGA